jgi:hypothetical protein
VRRRHGLILLEDFRPGIAERLGIGRLVGHAGGDVIRAAQLSAIPPRIAPNLHHVDKGQERV